MTDPDPDVIILSPEAADADVQIQFIASEFISSTGAANEGSSTAGYWQRCSARIQIDGAATREAVARLLV